MRAKHARTTADFVGTSLSRQRVRGQRGAATVELALVLPLFLLVVFGMIEFGLTYNNYISLRQGAREATRQGAVGNFGTAVTSSCQLTGTTGASTDIQDLMCQAKNQIGLAHGNLRVKVLAGSSADFSSAGTFAKGDSLIICVMYPVDPIVKFASPVLGGAVLKTKSSTRIETSYPNTETGGQETALAGTDWNWCTVSASAP